MDKDEALIKVNANFKNVNDRNEEEKKKYLNKFRE